MGHPYRKIGRGSVTAGAGDRVPRAHHPILFPCMFEIRPSIVLSGHHTWTFSPGPKYCLRRLPSVFMLCCVLGTSHANKSLGHVSQEPASGLRTSPVFSHFIFLAILRGGCCFLHFTDEARGNETTFPRSCTSDVAGLQVQPGSSPRACALQPLLWLLLLGSSVQWRKGTPVKRGSIEEQTMLFTDLQV